MIPGKDENLDVIEPGRAHALPRAKPRHRLFQPSKARRRLGQPCLAARYVSGCFRVAPGQVETGRTQIGERGKARHFGVGLPAHGTASSRLAQSSPPREDRGMTTGASIGGLTTDLKTGLAFLTRLPLAHSAQATGADVARAAWTFPIIGALVGGFGALAYWFANATGQHPFVSGVLALAA